MRKKRWTPVMGGALAGMLLIAGCQPVGKIDVAQIIANNASVKSMEGKQLIALEITPDPSDSIPADQQLFMDLFGTMKLNMTEVKAKSPLEVSVKGNFEYKKGSIPFQLTMKSQQEFLLWFEGAKKPILIKNNMDAMKESGEKLQKVMIEQMEQMQLRAVESAPKLVAALLGAAPNPKTISVQEAAQTIQGESLMLNNIHAEIYGHELIDLFKGFVTNLLSDEKALKEIIGVFYDIYAPMIEEIAKQAEEEELTGDGSSQVEMMLPFLKNKTLAVEFVYTMISEQLKKVMKDFDASFEQFRESESGKKLSEALNDKQVLKVDLYADGKQQIRKSNTELLLTMPEEDKSGVKQIKVTMAEERWNINQPVTLHTIDTKDGVVDISQSMGDVNASKLLASLDPKSTVYQLLKNDLKITKKEINMLMDDSSFSAASTKPYNDQGTVMVPLRFVSEQLDADVSWNDAAKQVTITDPLTGKVIVLTIDSTEATVNGSSRTLEKAAILVEGSTFVPVRFVSENLDAKVEWDQNMNMVKITRD
ncbi:copper amine oxidase N-terminal domain-containing protein [Paenibacillus silviterrae]|uniref:copper amine oxidase N-terminal domain-containing protein n=1 Tax=Paenibacillus silviterrae TaxID=3242194 RepID=UPI002543E5F4|nr:copper amine oxidase N-terminal domain-containing protein [Paenibacillus chinjuensis]